jgi:anthranilate phosphoribosyltransferase
MEEKLKEATSLIAKIVDGNDLTAKEAERAFTDIFLHDKEGYHYLALCATLHTKGEISDELLGLCRSTAKLGEKLTPKVSASKITDLAGTGGGKIKTINVSTAASFVVAGAGYTVAKQAMFGITSPTGSADIFMAFGIDNYRLKLNQVNRTLEKIGICPFYIAPMSPKLKNRSMLAKKIFAEKGITIKTAFHIAAFAFSPTLLKRRIYGCFSEKYLEVLGELFFKLGNERTLVLYGVDGLPEASNVGKTIVVDQKGKRIKRYTLTPRDFSLKKAKADKVRTGGRERNIIDFLRVLYDKEKGAKRDIVLANASASFYALGRVKSFSEGTMLARQIINEGLAFKKLETLVEALGDENKLENWKKKAGLL